MQVCAQDLGLGKGDKNFPKKGTCVSIHSYAVTLAVFDLRGRNVWSASLEHLPAGSHVVLATEATVRLGAYSDAIRRQDERASIKEIPCEMLVALAEEGWTGGDIATAIVRRYLEPVFDSGADFDSLILGCTHFPILRPAIESVVDQKTAIVDSASTTAKSVQALLDANGSAAAPSQAGQLKLLATDGATRFARIGGQFLGEPITAEDIEIVDL